MESTGDGIIAMYSEQIIEENTNNFQFRTVVELLNGKKNGTFVELGAADGVLGSTTYRLEKDFGWNGVLIEPLKHYYDKIRSYRNASFMFNICVAEQEGVVEFTRIDGYSNMLSGISNNYSKEHLSRISKEVNSMNQVIHKDMIECRKLESILKECNITQVDYLSVDVEGAELSVVKSLGMETNPIRPLLIGCENNYGENEVEGYLAVFGYTKVTCAGGDDFFLHDSR